MNTYVEWLFTKSFRPLQPVGIQISTTLIESFLAVQIEKLFVELFSKLEVDFQSNLPCDTIYFW